VSLRLPLWISGRAIDPNGCCGLSSPGQAGVEEGGASGLAGASMGSLSRGSLGNGVAAGLKCGGAAQGLLPRSLWGNSHPNEAGLVR
jgi:hypothetical protein